MSFSFLLTVTSFLFLAIAYFLNPEWQLNRIHSSVHFFTSLCPLFLLLVIFFLPLCVCFLPPGCGCLCCEVLTSFSFPYFFCIFIHFWLVIASPWLFIGITPSSSFPSLLCPLLSSRLVYFLILGCLFLSQLSFPPLAIYFRSKL